MVSNEHAGITSQPTVTILTELRQGSKAGLLLELVFLTTKWVAGTLPGDNRAEISQHSATHGR
jgi:hypothetical protein